MRISKYNIEGYHDPTVYEALVNIEKERKEAQKLVPGRYRPLVYICSPYAGDVLNNERKARRYCQFAVRKRAIPLASHLMYPQILNDDDPGDRQLGLFFGTVLLGKCDECWVFGETISAGMVTEIAKAKKRGIPIRYFTEDMEEVRADANAEDRLRQKPERT